MTQIPDNLFADLPIAVCEEFVDVLSYPAIAQWVQGCGWIEIGDQEGLGFTMRALHLGGVVFEDTECRSLTEAMASLESGLAVAMKELGIN